MHEEIIFFTPRHLFFPCRLGPATATFDRHIARLHLFVHVAGRATPLNVIQQKRWDSEATQQKRVYFVPTFKVTMPLVWYLPQFRGPTVTLKLFKNKEIYNF